MTFDELCAVAKKLTYRPGWWFELYVDPSDALVFRCGTWEPDSENPAGQSVPVTFTEARTRQEWEHWEEAQFLWWVREVLKKRVLHELDEWLRLDGRPLVEPHPEKGWKRGLLNLDAPPLPLPRPDPPGYRPRSTLPPFPDPPFSFKLGDTLRR